MFISRSSLKMGTPKLIKLARLKLNLRGLQILPDIERKESDREKKHDYAMNITLLNKRKLRNEAAQPTPSKKPVEK